MVGGFTVILAMALVLGLMKGVLETPVKKRRRR